MDALDRARRVRDARPPGSGNGPSGSGGGEQDDPSRGGLGSGRRGGRGGGRRGGRRGSKEPKEGGNRGRAVRSTARKKAIAAHEMAAKEVCFI
jgi:hypothetical protein